MKIISTKAKRALELGRDIKLNLGGGNTVIENMLNVDIRLLPTTDIIADLNMELDLIPNKSVVDVYSRHTFEHVENLEMLFLELDRICISGAKLKIIVPHFSNPFAYSDPTHKRFFGIYSLCYFSDNNYFKLRKNLPRYNASISFSISKIKLRFYKYSLLDKVINPILEKKINKHPSFLEFYEYRLSHFWPAHEIEYHLVIPKG